MTHHSGRVRPANGYGRRPARRTAHTTHSQTLLAKALAPLGNPPASSTDWTADVLAQAGAGGWRMFLNDQLGCCTASDSGHAVMTATANAGRIVIPTDDQIRALYSATSGYDGAPATDNGAEEVTVMAYLRTNGLAGVMLRAFGSMNPANLDHLRWAVELFRGVRLGVTLPQSAETQFDAGQPWVPVAGSPVVGGHDIRLVRYVPGWFRAVTWGGEAWVSPEWLSRYCDEAHAEWWADAADPAPAPLDPGLLAELAAVNDEMVAA